MSRYWGPRRHDRRLSRRKKKRSTFKRIKRKGEFPAATNKYMELAFHGFIRDIQNLLNKKIIPIELIQICHKFYFILTTVSLKIFIPTELKKHDEEKMEYQFDIKYKYLFDIAYSGGSTYKKMVKVERNKSEFAIKMVENVFMSLTKTKQILREIRILKILSSHQSIVELVDLVQPSSPLIKFSTLSIVFEFMPSDLKKIFTSNQYFSNLRIEYILYQILLAVKFIHDTGIIHNRIESQNVLINEQCVIRICDFCLARGVTENIYTIHPKSISPSYGAPESILLQQKKESLYGIDVWSVGCIFGELLQMNHNNCSDYKNRKILFPKKSQQEINNNYCNHLRVIFDLIGTPSSDEILKFNDKNVQIYLSNMPISRGHNLCKVFPSTKKQGIELLINMLKFDVDKRITVQKALNSPYFEHVRDSAFESKHQQIEKFQFDVDSIEDDDMMVLRALILEEIMYYNPEWRKKMIHSTRNVQLPKLYGNKD